MDRIDFRSDTVTWPTPAMREAMATAPVGDDVYGEDPTVNELEALAAEMLGFEAGLFVASGSMGNLVSILAHANRGDEAIVGEANHTYNWEAGGMAVLGGIMPRVLAVDEQGCMDLAAIEGSVRYSDPHLPRSRLILIENTAGGRYGAPLPLDYMVSVREIADRHDLIVHLDGARVFNAATASNVDVREITKHVHSVSFCLSKGLCAPVGSIVCGSAEFIHRAHRARKLVGGGMRQAGILAAAGKIALCEMSKRLDQDHYHARQLAEGLARIDGININLANVHTNMVFFSLADDVTLTAGQVAQQMREQYGVWVGAEGKKLFRALTHYWVGSAEIETFLTAIQQILSNNTTSN